MDGGALRRDDRHDDPRLDGVVAGTDRDRRPGAPMCCWCCSTTSGSPTSAATARRSTRRRSTRLAADGLRYTGFHTTAMCSTDPRGAADRPQPPLGRHGLPGELRQRVPRATAARSPPTCRHARRAAPTARLPQLPRRQVAPRRRSPRPDRPARSTAGRSAAGSTATTGSSTPRPISSARSSCATTRTSPRRATTRPATTSPTT